MKNEGNYQIPFIHAMINHIIIYISSFSHRLAEDNSYHYKFKMTLIGFA